MTHPPTHILAVQAKADHLVFGSAALNDIPTAEARARCPNGIGCDRTSPSYPYLASERALRTGSRRDLSNSRVREALFGHALSAYAARLLSVFLFRGMFLQAGVMPRTVFDALMLIPAAHTALLHKQNAALGMLELHADAVTRHERSLFGDLGVQAFLTAPVVLNSAVGEGLPASIAALPHALTADGVLARLRRVWYIEARGRQTSV